jgi:hypothetical protein
LRSFSERPCSDRCWRCFGGDRTAAAALLIGLAVSILPILLRVLPPLRRDVRTDEQGRYVLVTVVGLIVYVVLVAAAITLVEL